MNQSWLFLAISVSTLAFPREGMAEIPPNVPLGYLHTPQGWFHPSCVIEVRKHEVFEGTA